MGLRGFTKGSLGHHGRAGSARILPFPKPVKGRGAMNPRPLDISQGGALAEADSLRALDGFPFVTFEREFVRNVREM